MHALMHSLCIHSCIHPPCTPMQVNHIEKLMGIQNEHPYRVPDELKKNRFQSMEGQGYSWRKVTQLDKSSSPAIRRAAGEAASDAMKRAAIAIVDVDGVPPLQKVPTNPIPVVSHEDMCPSWRGVHPLLLSAPLFPEPKDWCTEAFMAAFKDKTSQLYLQQIWRRQLRFSIMIRRINLLCSLIRSFSKLRLQLMFC